jgi:hypothetical protein
MVNGRCVLLCYANGTINYDAENDRCLCKAGYEGLYCESLIVIRRIPLLLRAPPIFVENTINVAVPVVPLALSGSFFSAGMIAFTTLVLLFFVVMLLVAAFQHASIFRPKFTRASLMKKIN